MKDLTNENVIHVKKEGVQYLQFRKLLEYSDIINHAYSVGIEKDYRTERAGNKKVAPEELENAKRNFQELASAIGTNYENIVKARQNHTKNVQIVEEKGSGSEFYNEKYLQTDGLITSKPNIMLSTSNADCILLLFFDPIKKVIANTHSGWKGTLQRISVETVKQMQKNYGSNPEDIICCMCPSIRKCHFEVSQKEKELFESEFKELHGFIEKAEADQKWNIDTIYINKEILKNAGLKEENIIDSGICSVCESDQIHSFRVEGENYKLATAIIEIKGWNLSKNLIY